MNQSRCRFGQVDSCGPKEIRWRLRCPHGKGQFLWVVQPIEKHCQSLLDTPQQKSVTTSAPLLQLTALLPTGRCHINFFHMKNPPPAMRLFVKIVWSLIIIIIIMISSNLLLLTYFALVFTIEKVVYQSFHIWCWYLFYFIILLDKFSLVNIWMMCTIGELRRTLSAWWQHS